MIEMTIIVVWAASIYNWIDIKRCPERKKLVRAMGGILYF
jgi:hypothetical protein